MPNEGDAGSQSIGPNEAMPIASGVLPAELWRKKAAARASVSSGVVVGNSHSSMMASGAGPTAHRKPVPPPSIPP